MDNIELNNKSSVYNSLYIILNQYKKEHITEEEAVQLIEDLYKNNRMYIPYIPIPYIPPNWPQITYEQPQYQHFEVICNQ